MTYLMTKAVYSGHRCLDVRIGYRLLRNVNQMKKNRNWEIDEEGIFRADLKIAEKRIGLIHVLPSAPHDP